MKYRKFWTIAFLAIVEFVFAQEIPITPGAAGNQINPQVAGGSSCFFVLWEDYRAGSSNSNIYGVAVYPDATTSSLAILCVASNNQTYPAVAYNPSADNFFNIWFDQRTSAQTYSITSDCTPNVGTESLVDNVTSNMYYTEIAFSGNAYLYVWMYNNAGAYETRYEVLNSSGVPVGGVQTPSGAGSKNPDVAYDGYAFLVVWEDSLSDGKGIYGKYFDSNGTPISSAFMLVQDTTASAPAVCGVEGATASESKFLVVWQHYDLTTNSDIYSAVVPHMDTTTITSLVPVCTQDNVQAEPDVASHQNGFLVVWKDRRSGYADDIYGRFLDSSGNPTGDDFAICDSTGTQRAPKVAFSESIQKYLCVWSDYRNGTNEDIYGAFVSVPSVQVISPNGGETLSVATNYEIKWSSSLVDSVKILYSTDNGSSWITITPSTPSDGSYTWTVPDTPSDECLVKIASTSDTSVQDVSDGTFVIAPPDTFALVGELDGISATKKVEVYGNYAFLPARESGTLKILAVDVSDSSNPVVVAGTAIPNGAYGMGIEVIDTIVCLSTSDEYLHTFDFNGDTLVLLGSYDINGQGGEVVGRDTMVWVAAYDSILWLSIGDPASPYELAGFSASSQFKGLCLEDTFLFSTEAVLSGGSRFRILRANDPSQFYPAGGSVNLNGYGEDVDGDYSTGYMFVADGVTQATNTGRMISVDVTNMALPESTGAFTSDGAPIKAIAVWDTFAFLANDTFGVKIVSIADPTNPTLVKTLTIPAPGTRAVDVFTTGDFLYVLTDSSLLIYRINLEAAKMRITSWVFGDSSDGDGYFEPGETLGLTVEIQNTGTDTLTDAWLGASVLSGNASLIPPTNAVFGDVPPGGVDTAYFAVVIDTDAATPGQVRILLGGHSTNGGNPSDTAVADIIDTSPVMEIKSWAFYDSSDGDGYFERGETLALFVEVDNSGIDPVHDAWVRISILSGEGSIVGPDSVWLGTIDSAAIDTAYFEIQVSETAPTPSQIQVLISGFSLDGGEPKDTAVAGIVDRSPVMEIVSWVFRDSSDGDGRFEPGETLGLTVEIKNSGLDTLHDAWVRATVFSSNGTVLNPDSVWIGSLDTQQVDTAFFRVAIDSGAMPPDTLRVQLSGHSADGGNPTDTAVAPIVDKLPEFSIISWEFFDSTDGNGRFEPGETLALFVVVKSTGLDPLHGAWMDVSVITGNGTLISGDSVWFGDMDIGVVDTAVFMVAVDSAVVPIDTLEVQLNGHSADDGNPVDTAIAQIVGPNPVVEISSWAFYDSSDGDGRFEPGETLALQVVLASTGDDPVHDIWIRGEVVSGNGAVIPPDSAWVGAMDVGDVDTLYLSIRIDSSAATPSTLGVVLMVHSRDDGNPIDTAAAEIVSGAGGFWDDMESGPGDWNPDPHWHLLKTDASSPTHAWYCGDSISELYDNDWTEDLISPWMKIPGDDAELVVHHRYNTENSYDFCYIAVDTGNGWEVVDSFNGTSQGRWERWSFDLSSMDPGDSVRVAFRFESDGSVVGNGWWIDDVYLQSASEPDIWGPRCYPPVALITDSITFSVNYYNADGVLPSSARVVVGDTSFTLHTTDTDPSDGALYYVKVKLPAWNYTHHFEFVLPRGEILRFPRRGDIEGPFVNDTVVVYWSFELDGHGTGSGAWEYGTPSSGPGSAHSGSKLWATVLDGNYPNNSRSTLIFDPIDLSEAEHPELRMWIWYSMESRYGRTGYRDAANVWIIHGADTVFLNPIYEYPGIGSYYLSQPVGAKPAWGDNDVGNFWHRVHFDLSRWSGDTVKIMVRFASNYSISSSGIYIDDVSVLKEYEIPPYVSVAVNGGDSAMWAKEADIRGEVLCSGAEDSIRITNVGNTPMDILLGLFDVDLANFRYVDSTCYGCFGVWTHITGSNLPVPPEDFNDTLDWLLYDSLVPADSLRFGPAGWDIPPDSSNYLWIKLRTPEYYSQDTLTARILLKVLIHTP